MNFMSTSKGSLKVVLLMMLAQELLHYCFSGSSKEYVGYMHPKILTIVTKNLRCANSSKSFGNSYWVSKICPLLDVHLARQPILWKHRWCMECTSESAWMCLEWCCNISLCIHIRTLRSYKVLSNMHYLYYMHYLYCIYLNTSQSCS